MAELFLTASSADEKRRDQTVTQLARLARLGRAAGLYLEVCGQRFGAELGKGVTALRAQLTARIGRGRWSLLEEFDQSALTPSRAHVRFQVGRTTRGSPLTGDGIAWQT